ncbi:unnamed protein product [Rhizophagus irregularis]|nr:unnamed protein product [Rhizophagus irregularis]CAB4426502.1 unnamed protein product [Rhizophagus irregularis]
MRGRRYVPQKEAQINDERDTGHHMVEGIHNHELVENIGMVTLRYRKLNPKMHNDVKLLATCEVRASAIIEVLQKKYPDK